MTTTIEDARALVNKWVHAFGLGNYTYAVTVIPDGEAETQWGRSCYAHEEEWFEMQVVEGLPVKTLEALVLHELAHGILSLAAEGSFNTEQACNRIARLALGNRTGGVDFPNIRMLRTEKGWRKSAAGLLPWRSMSKGKPTDQFIVSMAIELLPEEEAQVINGLFWEHIGLQRLADRMDLTKWQVRAIRDRALNRLRGYLEEVS